MVFPWAVRICYVDGDANRIFFSDTVKPYTPVAASLKLTASAVPGKQIFIFIKASSLSIMLVIVAEM